MRISELGMRFLGWLMGVGGFDTYFETMLGGA